MSILTSGISRVVRGRPTDHPELYPYIVAVQLLASCYTLCRPQSGSDSLLNTRKWEREYITALRLHGQYRFSPAAGHHARESSMESWPALFSGPSIEEQRANAVTTQRLVNERGREQQTRRSPSELTESNVQDFKACEWSDGPAGLEVDVKDRENCSGSTSSSSSDAGCFMKLRTHQPLRSIKLSRNAEQPSIGDHKPDPGHGYPGSLGKSRNWMKFKTLVGHFAAKVHLHPIVRIPSQQRLRRTQSDPKKSNENLENNTGQLPQSQSRRSSSTPAFRSPVSYPHEIPIIRRISATSLESEAMNIQIPEDDGTGWLRPYIQDYFGEAYPSRVGVTPLSEGVAISKARRRPTLTRNASDTMLITKANMSPERNLSNRRLTYVNGVNRERQDAEVRKLDEGTVGRGQRRQSAYSRRQGRPATGHTDSEDSVRAWDRRRHGVFGDIGWMGPSATA